MNMTLRAAKPKSKDLIIAIVNYTLSRILCKLAFAFHPIDHIRTSFHHKISEITTL